VHAAIGEVGITARRVVSARLPETFTTAFAGLYSSSFNAAYRLLGNRQEAEDIAQEACARCCLRWDRLTKYGEIPKPWVVRVATNLAIDHYRKRQRALAKGDVAPIVVEEMDARRVDLHRALEQLTRRQRDVVVLRYVADLSEADTAAALGCAPGTVKSHATRGLAALRAALGEKD
jgi:RNA polymerase sigma-70 factor (sigma-E family)